VAEGGRESGDATAESPLLQSAQSLALASILP
jgi:hypothetical protein